MTVQRVSIAACVASAFLAWPAPTRADDGDGLYGRFDGDMDVRLHGGIDVDRGGAALALSASCLYLSTAGLYAHYQDHLEASSSAELRSLAFGVHLAPLFLARYARNWEQGPARLDIALDSLGFELGPFWSQRRAGRWVALDQPGFELAVTMSLPLFARASGPFIAVRGALRFRDGDTTAASSRQMDTTGLLSVTLGYRQVFTTHAVDSQDRRPSE